MAIKAHGSCFFCLFFCCFLFFCQSAARTAHRTAHSTPTHAHAPRQNLYMLIKSLWTSFVLQATSIPFAPRVLCHLQAQRQTHTGMIKSSNCLNVHLMYCWGSCVCALFAHHEEKNKQTRELLQSDEIRHAAVQRSPPHHGISGCHAAERRHFASWVTSWNTP